MVLRVEVPASLIRGDADDRYGLVADQFRRNFTERREIGAACAVYVEGRKVVDLWGGYRDGVRRAPWEEDTLVTGMSRKRGISSFALAVLHARGLLDYDERVATYWPEFGAKGKGQ